MEDLNEKLLSAWLRLSVNITNERVVSDMPYKEALVCNLLSKAEGGRLTATDLCEQTKMLKSQMNRTLNSLEEKGLICRKRSDTDKRLIYVALTFDSERIELYHREHAKNLKLVDAIIERFGVERAECLIQELTEIADIAEEVLG